MDAVRGAAPDALEEARSIQAHASTLGFDWPDISGVLAKVREELEEIEEALAQRDMPQAQRELGDLLFSAVNVARFLDADPAVELHGSNARFRARFEQLQRDVAQSGRRMEECTLEELDEVWDRIKAC